jgi:HlyD family secretion protein
MMRKLMDLWIKRRTLVIVAALAMASAAVFGVVHYSTKPPAVPTFQVKRGEFLDVIQFHGQLKAMKSVTITAPADAGDLQILKIVQDGTQVK